MTNCGPCETFIGYKPFAGLSIIPLILSSLEVIGVIIMALRAHWHATIAAKRVQAPHDLVLFPAYRYILYLYALVELFTAVYWFAFGAGYISTLLHYNIWTAMVMFLTRFVFDGVGFFLIQYGSGYRSMRR